jgi:hypothetical protein
VPRGGTARNRYARSRADRCGSPLTHAVWLTKHSILMGFWLRRKIENPRFERVDFIPPDNYVYQLRLRDPGELDAELAAWLKEARETTGAGSTPRAGSPPLQ